MSMFGSGDPDNPMGGLLGDLLKVIGSGPGGGAESWYEAARTLAFGVATDAGHDDHPDPLVRIGYEELARVAELHVAEATGIAPHAGPGGVSFEAVGPGQWSHRVLEAYRPVLASMVEAQQQGAASVPTSLDLSRLDTETPNGLSGLLGQFAQTLGPVFLGMQFGSAAGHLAQRAFGQYALPLPWPETSALLLVPANVARFAEDWSLPLQEVQLWVCVRELAMHAVLTRPGVRASLTTLLGDASAHAAAAQRSMVERLGEGLGDPTSLEDALGDPEALLADLITPEQRSLSGALTAQTTALGAYVDHVTAQIAGKLTASSALLREAWYRYRIEEGTGEQAFAGLFGLNVGQDEVDRGRNFVSGVLERVGEGALARLCGDGADLPTPAEVDAPGLWLARIGLLD
jgi:putative hydrolase